MTSKTIRSFDGPAGTVAAKVMARMNRGAEVAAVETLAPGPHDTVLAIGFGPGVGVELLAARLVGGRVVGVDPSGVMMREATRRNARFIDHGKVQLHRAGVQAIPVSDASCDGAIAVNSAQLWQPFADGVAEVARVLRPGARLVTLTHDWALEKQAGRVDAWLESARETLERHGFTEIEHWRAHVERGRSITLCARLSRR